MSPAECQILLLEDDHAIAALVAATLQDAGFVNVRSSSSIAGARQCWHAQLGNFDIFLTDFSLPDGCAPEFIEELLRWRPALRVILMSGYSEEALNLEGGLSRQLRVLLKPFLPSELVDEVRAAIAANEALPRSH